MSDNTGGAVHVGRAAYLSRFGLRGERASGLRGYFGGCGNVAWRTALSVCAVWVVAWLLVAYAPSRLDGHAAGLDVRDIDARLMALVGPGDVSANPTDGGCSPSAATCGVASRGRGAGGVEGTLVSRASEQLQQSLLHLVLSEEGEARASKDGLVSRVVSRVLLASATGRRYVWLLRKSIGDRLCGLENGTCDVHGYLFYMLGIFGPCVLVGILGWMFVPCFIILRCCCGCCGGRKPRPGVCCGRGDEEKLYPKAEIIGVKAVMLLLFVLFIICLAFGYAGNTKAGKGFRGLTGSAIVVAQDLVNNIENINLQLQEIRSVSAPDLAEALDTANDFLRSIQDADDYVETADDYRAAAINISLIVPLFFLMISVVTGVLNVRAKCLHIVLASLIILFMLFVWVSCGLHWVFEVLFSDGCFEIHDFLQTPASLRSPTTNPLEELFRCADNSSSPFRELEQTCEDGIANAVTVACTALTDSTFGLCNAPNVDCSNTGFPTTPCTETTITRYMESTIANATLEAGGTDTVQMQFCADPGSPQYCASGINRDVSTTLSNSVSDIDRLNQILVNNVRPIIRCTFLTNLLNLLLHAVCDQLAGGIGSIRKAQLALGIFTVVAFIAMVLGQKRFLPLSRSLEAADDASVGYDDESLEMKPVDVTGPGGRPAAASQLAMSYSYSDDPQYADDNVDALMYDSMAPPPPSYDTFDDKPQQY